MVDLVQRLEDAGVWYGENMPEYVSVCNDAKDEIERLRGVLAKLADEITAPWSAVEMARAALSEKRDTREVRNDRFD